MAAFLLMPDGTEIEIEDGMVLGRVQGCHVVIADSKASRRHARFISQRGVVEIEDLESSNGTKLNGKDITRRMLRNGDLILIGKTSITYAERAATGAAPASDLGGGDDLFGDDPSAPTPPAQPQVAPAPAVPPAAAEPPDVAPREVEVRQPPQPGPPAASEPEDEVLEFADDDVVVVKRTLPEPGKKTRSTPAQDPASARAGGVLQFQKVEDKAGFFGHDLGQMSQLQRIVMFLVALAVAGLLFYLAMQLTASW